MAKYKFRISVLEYGVLEVEADSYEDARDKAYECDGTFYPCDSEVTDVERFSK
jgi:hypothetical protein